MQPTNVVESLRLYGPKTPVQARSYGLAVSAYPTRWCDCKDTGGARNRTGTYVCSDNGVVTALCGGCGGKVF